MAYEEPEHPSTQDESILRAFGGDAAVDKFLKRLKESDPRYFLAKCARIIKIQKHHSTDSILNAIQHCVNSQKYDVSELLAYIIYKHGAETVKKHTNKTLFLSCNKRAKEIEEEYHGKHQ